MIELCGAKIWVLGFGRDVFHISYVFFYVLRWYSSTSFEAMNWSGPPGDPILFDHLLAISRPAAAMMRTDHGGAQRPSTNSAQHDVGND